MKVRLQNTLIILMIVLLTACGGLPLVQPGATITSNTQSPLATPKIVEGSMSSPLATPASSQSSPTPLYPPIATPVLAIGASTPAVKAIGDTPLLSPNLLAKMRAKDNTSISVEVWSSSDEIILRVGYEPNTTFWTVSRAKDQVSQVATLQPNQVSTAAIEELRQFDKRVDYVHVSPDGRWGAWGFGETLLIKQLGMDKPPVNLLGRVQYEEFGHLIWSPKGDQIAYTVKNDPLGRYEIRISDPLGQQIKGVALNDTGPGYMAWSPDGQFLAFEMQQEPQSDITNIYLIKQDGSGLTQLTQHGLAGGPIHWSPKDSAIAYVYGRGDGRRPWLVTITK